MTTPERGTAEWIAATTLLISSDKCRLADAIQSALLAAKAEEREACAQLASENKYVARRIRARGVPAAVKEANDGKSSD